MGAKSFFIIALFAILFVSLSNTMRFAFLDDDLTSMVQEMENEEEETEMEEEYAKLIHYEQYILFGVPAIMNQKNATLYFKSYSEPHLTVTTPPPNFILS